MCSRTELSPISKVQATSRTCYKRATDRKRGIGTKNNPVGIEQKEVSCAIGSEQSINVRDRLTCYAANNVLNIQGVIEVGRTSSGYSKLFKGVELVDSRYGSSSNDAGVALARDARIIG